MEKQHRLAGLSEEAIQGIIRRKITAWLNSIDDKEVAKSLAGNIIVSGGAIASMLLGDPVNDFDVYFATYDVAKIATKYYVDRFMKNAPPKYKGMQICVYTNAKQQRVKIFMRSAGMASVAQEDADSQYQYFETVQDQQAAVDYVANVTAVNDDESSVRGVNESVDIDVTAADAVDTVAAQFERLADSVPPKAVGAGAKAKNSYRPLFLSGNAITLSDGIQLCIRFSGSPDEIHKNFDFVHCTNYWKSSETFGRLGGDLVLNLPALKSLMSKKLKYVGSRYPLCSLIRTRKFVARGWSAPASVYIKAMWQATQLDWNNFSTWEDQLTGVDTTYFAEILSILRKDIESGKTLDGAYIVAMIDRLM